MFWEIFQFLNRLNGYKILVKGNHDELICQAYLEMGFNEVSNYPIIVDGFYILSHEPVFVNKQMAYCNIYGHVHDDLHYNDYTEQTFCASIEKPLMYYCPMPFEEIKIIMKEARGGI